MHQAIDTKKLITISIIVILILAGIFFLYTVFTSVVKPLVFDKREDMSSTSLDTTLDEAVDYLKQRQDLTASTPSATLNVEAKNIVAEIINGSGKSGAAKALADELEGIGITVSQVSNSSSESAITRISLKNTGLPYKDDIVAKIGTKSAEIQFETLQDSDTFDIRILIGK